MKDFSKWTEKDVYELMLKALQNNIAEIVYSNGEAKYCGCSGICCKCGDTCFYFAGMTGEEYTSAKDYIKDTDLHDNARDIADVVCEFLSEPDDGEGRYILSYVSERLSALEKKNSISKKEKSITSVR